MQTLKNIAENYRICSARLGLSESDIADRSGMPLDVVRNVADGIEFRVMPIYHISRALGMTIDDFVAPPKESTPDGA